MSEIRVDSITDEEGTGRPSFPNGIGDNAILVPIGTTAERPSSPQAGEIRFNTDLNTFEGYDGSVWGGGGATVTVTGNHTVAAPPAYGTSIVNVDAATATITIPEDVPVGGRIHVRKINSTQGTVAIERSGSDTITRAALTSVRLNADGDHWLLQKVSSTRWELVGGVESGSNGNGDYVRQADGTTLMQSVNIVLSTFLSGSTLGTDLWSFPAEATGGVVTSGGARVTGSAAPPARDIHVRVVSSIHTTNGGFRAESVNQLFEDGDSIIIQAQMVGRWYS